MKDLTLPALHETRVWSQEHPELAACGIDRAGLTHVHGAYSRTAHDADFHVAHVQVALHGKAEVRMPAGWVTLPLNVPYVVPVGANWGWRYEPEGDPLELLFVRLLPGKTTPPALRPGLCRLLPEHNPDDLLWSFQRLYRECVTANRTAVIQCLAELIAIHTREIISYDEATNFLADLWVYVLSDLTAQWTVAALARRVSMSQEKLRLLCLRETGRSPMRQVTHLRMQKAAVLLTESDHSIEQISYLVGYENPFGFSTAFRRRFGTSPREYRKKNA